MKIAVVGIGYVGLSLATLLSQRNEVVAVDIIKDKVDMINNRVSPIKDEYIEKYFDEKKLNLRATLDYKEAFCDADFIIISTPTNYDEEMNSFDTSSVEDVIERVKSMNLNATIVIKSTVPVGYTNYIKNKYNMDNIIFSPEFLREGQALYDNLYPSRIIVGGTDSKSKEFGKILKDASLKKDVVVKYMNSAEAEAVKLFANSYLALRIAYFNELDTFAELKGLDSKSIIEGVCLDPRIGNFYNNPSFGYGGYCLPKDTKQLFANYTDVPQNLIGTIISSNDTRKKHIANMIMEKNPKVVGVYRLNMKKGSTNNRESATIDIVGILKINGVNVMIYEPNINVNTFMGFEVIHDLKLFKELSSIIIANRVDNVLDDVKHKVYTRDLFSRD